MPLFNFPHLSQKSQQIKPFSLALFLLFSVLALYKNFEISIEFFLKSVYLLTEVIALYFLGVAAKNTRNAFAKFIMNFSFWIISVIFITQTYSALTTGGYISSMAIANRQTAYTTETHYYLLYAMLAAFLLAQTIERKKIHQKRLGHASLFMISAATLALAAKSIHGIPSSDNISIKVGESPVRSFIKSNLELREGKSKLFNQEFKEINAKFQKFYIFRDTTTKPLIPQQNNIIVIFTEGMSARWSEFYNGRHKGLMPNLDLFAEESLVFKNYYNHSAATFRGLRGQLISGHQDLGGFDDGSTGLGQRGALSYFSPFSASSLPVLLRNLGYTSLFYLSQQNKLNEMLETLGFDKVYGRDLLRKNYLQRSTRKKVLSDQELFSALLASLKQQSRSGKFFAAVYNFDTHAFLDGNIPYLDGSNSLLNRFHTYDTRLGKFLNEFRASELHENTTLIVTSDHATFPDQITKEADPSVPPHFVDQIPLIIYQKGISPQIIDAKNQTSVAFAPTLLHLMGINNAPNKFFGCSIFDECERNLYANVGNQYFSTYTGKPSLIDTENMTATDAMNVKLIDDFKKINRYVSFSEETN